MNKSSSSRKPSKSPPRKKPGKFAKVPTKSILQSNSYNGSLDIRADKLELTPIGEKFVRSLIGKRGSVKVYWNFMNFPAASTPAIQITHKQVDIKHTACYEVAINEAFLRYLSTRPVTFEVYMVNYKQEILMGRGDVIFKELMNSPNEPIHVVVEVSNLEKALLVNNPNLFRIYAQLSISYQLKCDVKSICRLMKKRYNKLDIETFMHNLVENLVPKDGKHIDTIDEDYDSDVIHEPISLIEVTENTIAPMQGPKMLETSSEATPSPTRVERSTTNTVYHTSSNEGLSESSKLKVRRRKKHTIFKKSRRSSSSEESLRVAPKVAEGKTKSKKEKAGTSKEEKSPILDENLSEKLGIVKKRMSSVARRDGKEKNWMEDIPDVKRILEEFAILCGEDPSIVNSPTWKEVNLSKVYLRSYTPHPSYYYPEVVIYIHSLKLYDDCHLMKDDSIKSFYLEYSFLSHEGVDMESQGMQKLPNNSLFKFNFKKTFPIDLVSNFPDCKILANMIREKKTIVIEVISEPVEDMRKIQSCEIVGYCEIGLFDLIQLEDNVLKAKFEVKNFKNNSETIGYFRITFSGIQAMRTVALQLLSPSSYKDQLRVRYAVKDVPTQM